MKKLLICFIIKKIFLLFNVLFYTVYVNGQITVVGGTRIWTEEEKIPIPLTKVTYLNKDDTTKVEFVTVSDFEGKYYLGKIPENLYRTFVSTPDSQIQRGYANVKQNQGNYWQIHFYFENKNENLNKNYIPKGTAFFIDDNIRKKSKTVNDLLLNVTGLEINNINSIILIDGRYADKRKIQKISVKNIENFDLYKLPVIDNDPNPYTTVININTNKGRVKLSPYFEKE